MNTDEQKIYQSGLTQTLNNKLTCQRARRKKRRKAWTDLNSGAGWGGWIEEINAYYTKWNKPGIERQIPYDLTYKWNLIDKPMREIDIDIWK